MSHESSQSSSLPAGLVGVAVDFDPFASDAPVIERVIIPTDAQREVWLADHMSQEASLAYNEAVELSLKGRWMMPPSPACGSLSCRLRGPPGTAGRVQRRRLGNADADGQCRPPWSSR